LRCFFLPICIRIRIVAILALILVDITGWQVKALQFRHGPLSLAGDVDDTVIVSFITFIFVIPAAY
jgi:hypothetical protein